MRSEAAVAEIWLKVFAFKFALISVAGLTGLMGLAFVNIGLYSYLTSIWGPVWTPLAIALGNVLLAVLALLAAMRAKPNSDLPMAEELRKLSLDSLGQEFNVSTPGSGVFGEHAGFANQQVTRLLIPAIISIVTAMRRRKDATKK